MKTLAAVVGAVLVTAGIVANVGAKPEQKGPQVVQFSAVQVRLTKEHLTPDRKWLRAFIPSGSKDERVLVGINGQWVPGAFIQVAGGHVNTSDLLGDGVSIWAWCEKPLPDEVSLVLTVAQPGADFKKPIPLDLSKQFKAP